MNLANPPALMVDFDTGQFQQGNIQRYTKRLKDLAGVFKDPAAFAALDPATVVYEVESLFPVPEGTKGGSFWGRTYILPGLVGSEYFMTRGHYHARREQAEFSI